MRYFKRPGLELRDDEYASWGTSTYFFEVGPDNFAERQIEVYQRGTVLTYDRAHLEDAFGGLSEAAFDLEADGFLPFEITVDEFESAWLSLKPANRSLGEGGQGTP